MKHTTTAALAACAAFACSDPGFQATDEAGDELGQAEQPYIYLDSATRQWGTQTGSDRLSCNKTSTSQTCTFATFKNIELARPNAWTTAQKNALVGIANAMQARFTGWTFPVTDSANPPLANHVRLLLSDGAVAGSLTNFVNGYRSVSFFSPVALTEGLHPGLAAPVGNYQRHGSCSATIDFADIFAKGTSAIEDGRIQDHILINTVEVCMGVGTRNDASGTASQRAISPSTVLSLASNGEVCRASISEVADTADISRQTASACAD